MRVLRKRQMINGSSSEQLKHSYFVLYEEIMYSNASSLTFKIISITFPKLHTPNYTHMYTHIHPCTLMYTHVHSCTLIYTHLYPSRGFVHYCHTVLYIHICVHHVHQCTVPQPWKRNLVLYHSISREMQ